MDRATKSIHLRYQETGGLSFSIGTGDYNISMHLQWTDYDPQTKNRRFIRAERFAGKWTFSQRATRRGVWQRIPFPEKQLWVDLLESLERRLSRREGIELGDVAAVKKMLENWKDPPQV